MEDVRRVLAAQLGLDFAYPSTNSLVHSTRCLLYDNDEGRDGNEDAAASATPGPPPREVVVKACPPGIEPALLAALGKLYEACEVVEATPTAPLWARLPRAPMAPKHPGLLPLLTVCRSAERLYLVSDYHPHNLLTLLHFSSQSLLESSLLGRMSRESVKELRLYFLFHQLIRVLAFYHSHGLALGNLSMKSVYVSDLIWLRVLPTPPPSPSAPAATASPRVEPLVRPPGYDTPLTLRWMNGQVDNYTYLMAINAAAGRSMIDATFHPVLPWVSDLKVHGGGWRDLTKTKFRLTKGDAQLDTAYRHSTPPHHITESLSEITYYIYLARRTPLGLLRRVVRADVVPEHYPAHMARMYEWTPDECIPEFFVDPSVFVSLHRGIGMVDIAFPSWCADASAFVAYHRALLESDEVSARLHHWIDLTFGHCLEGAAAVQNKNVPLQTGDAATGHRLLARGTPNPGFVQVFREPHPQRHSLRQGMKVLTPRDLEDDFAAGAGSVGGGRDGAGPGGSAPFMMAVEGVEVTDDEDEMLRRAPTIPVEARNVQHLRACLDSLDVVQAVGSFSHKVQRRLEPAYSLSVGGGSSAAVVSPATRLQQQQDDMFAAGCILAELYLGEPVLSVQDKVGQASHNKEEGPLAWLPGKTSNLPFQVRALLHALLQTDPIKRPRAMDLLDTGDGTDSSDEEEEEDGGRRPNGLGLTGDVIFPSFFDDLHRYLSMVYVQQQRDPFESISVTLSLAQQLVELPLAAFALVLPYMLQVLDDPVPFEAYERRSQHLGANNNNNNGNGGSGKSGDLNDHEEEEQATQSPRHQQHQGDAPVVLRLNPFLDLVGQKLGNRHTQRLLFPRVASFMERLTDSRLLRALFVSPIWSILVRRGGTTGFITHFLPFMLKMVGPEAPLEVQQAAYVAVFNLGSPDILGPGLVARYVVPSLLEGIGKLREPGEDKEGAAATETAAAATWGEDLYQARALINIGKEIGDDVLVSLVAEHLLMDVVPSLEQHWMPEPSVAVSLALLECVTVLEGLLPTLQASSAVFHYCQQPSLPVQQLLLAIPLPPPPSTPSSSPATAPLVPHSPRHRLHIQVCRLATALSMCIGARATEQYLLPAINTFLGGFTELYQEGGKLPSDAHAGEGEGGGEEETWPLAAFDMMEDLWRHLESLYDDASLRRLVPNGLKLVSGWYHQVNGEGRGSHHRTALGAQHGSSGKDRRGGGEKERLTDLFIEKSLSGLSWIANKSRKRFGRAGGEGAPSSSSPYARQQQEGGAEIMLKERSPTAQREETEEEDDDHEELVADERHTRRVSTAGKDVLLPISPSTALGSSPLSLSPARVVRNRSDMVQQDSDDEREDYEVDGHEGDADLGLWGSQLSSASPKKGEGKASRGPLGVVREGSSDTATTSSTAMPPLPFLTKKKDSAHLAEGRSAKREAWSSRMDKDHVWLLGPLVDPPRLQPPALLPEAGSSWPIHMCVQTSLEAYKSGSSVRSLAVDPAETVLLSGSRRGVIKVWSLREYPVALAQLGGGLEHHTESIFSLNFLNGSDYAVSLDGSLVVWDVNTGSVLVRKEKYAPEIGGMPFAYMAVDVLPVGGGVGLGDSRNAGGHHQHHQLLAATQTTLYHFDLRDRASSSSSVLVASQASEWGVSSSCFQDRGIGAALQCVTTHDDGYWICTGSSNGQMCVLDRRTGEIAQAWQAHEAPILRVFPWSRDKVLSVSMDRTAVLWDIRSTIPRDICCLRGLPDSPSGMTVLNHEFRRSSAAAAAGGKRPHILMSFGGHKGVVARMPRSGMDLVAKSRYFLSPNGLKLRAKINVQSATLLPLRNLLLVGCDDGIIRVCT